MAFRTKKKKAPIEEDWLTTYADAITLLMCFFVLILNIAEPKASMFEQMRNAMMSEFSTTESDTPVTDMVQSFEAILQKQSTSDEISMEVTGNGLMMDIHDMALFEPGSATIRDAAKPLLDDLALELVKVEYDLYRIIVEGHTDDEPIRSQQFPSNWELSAARAAAVVRYFIEKGIPPQRLTASGYAESFPKKPNRDHQDNPIPENQAINRRISIVMERE
jgi:chemotaxis protein MotB